MKNNRIEKDFKAEGIREAAKRLDYLKLTEAERIEYDIYRKNISSIEYKYETYFEKGIEKGIEKGEKNKQLEIARTLKKMGDSIEKIMKATGLTKAEIEKL